MSTSLCLPSLGGFWTEVPESQIQAELAHFLARYLNIDPAVLDSSLPTPVVQPLPSSIMLGYLFQGPLSAREIRRIFVEHTAEQPIDNVLANSPERIRVVAVFTCHMPSGSEQAKETGRLPDHHLHLWSTQPAGPQDASVVLPLLKHIHEHYFNRRCGDGGLNVYATNCYLHAMLNESVQTTFWSSPEYNMWLAPTISEAQMDEYQRGSEPGSIFVLESTQERFMYDYLRLADIQPILDNSTVEYSTEYIRMLITRNPMSKIHRVLRKIPDDTPASETQLSLADHLERFSSQAPAAWCLSHIDQSMGLLSTLASMRRRGLGNRVAVACWAHQRKILQSILGSWGISDPWTSFCFIKIGNEASERLFASLGFRPIHKVGFFWQGVQP
ncbi:uncharacterized protein BJ171DRAFT_597169 [Polychytrium aggregatum]|uniref:uncharacterized protein n=1 Tax=Polychytrium aggregatum TaxID=110093 RepID=UPI0022FEF7D1|nr:uncharacterized protein BJ171DRAFT_597169 [Polychytrium aggregatum]KAI9207063.1 hypothetical protein BJ171DRAFT_597169 [Polychytrium aggregatum]